MLVDLLDQAKFVEWIDQHNEEDTLGIAGMPEQCPVARYLNDQCKGRKIIVGVMTFAYLDAPVGEVETMPEWAKALVLYLDHHHWRERITPKLCKNALDMMYQ